MMEGTVKVSGLSKTFGSSGLLKGWTKNVRALADIDFVLEKGELAAVVGESGSGKTTLGRCVMGLLPFEAGSALVNGYDVGRLDRKSDKAFRMSAQMVFQNPYSSLNPAFKARDALIEAVRVHKRGISKAEASMEADRLAAMVNLHVERLDELPPKLSGGEKRRVVFARALATNPSFVVTDEPVSGLDQPIQAQLLDMLKKIHQRHQTTMLFISHDLRLVRFIATRVIVMHRGRIVEDAPSDEFFGEGVHHPYSSELLWSAFSCDIKQLRESLIRPPDRGSGGCAFRHRCPMKIEDRGAPCENRTPLLAEIAPNHRVACHRFA